jgi:uncharacterized protein YjbI with pentapeptide repeats
MFVRKGKCAEHNKLFIRRGKCPSLKIHRLNFERLNFVRPNFVRLNFERPNFERLNFERHNFERPNFKRLNFERLNFEKDQTFHDWTSNRTELRKIFGGSLKILQAIANTIYIYLYLKIFKVLSSYSKCTIFHHIGIYL